MSTFSSDLAIEWPIERHARSWLVSDYGIAKSIIIKEKRKINPRYDIYFCDRHGKFIAWLLKLRPEWASILMKCGKFIKIEIKCQSKRTDKGEWTGNVFVETWNVNKGRPSGLQATKSDIWIEVLHGNVMYITLTALMRRLIVRIDAMIKPSTWRNCVGDGASGYLFREDYFLLGWDGVKPNPIHVPLPDAVVEELMSAIVYKESQIPGTQSYFDKRMCALA